MAGELPFAEKEEALLIGGGLAFGLPLILATPVLWRAYNVFRTPDILANSRDAGRKYAIPASKSLKENFWKNPFAKD